MLKGINIQAYPLMLGLSCTPSDQSMTSFLRPLAKDLGHILNIAVINCKKNPDYTLQVESHIYSLW